MRYNRGRKTPEFGEKTKIRGVPDLCRLEGHCGAKSQDAIVAPNNGVCYKQRMSAGFKGTE